MYNTRALTRKCTATQLRRDTHTKTPTLTHTLTLALTLTLTLLYVRLHSYPRPPLRSSLEKVFFNLECLAARVKACVTHLAGEAEDAVSDALQPAALADATSSSASSGASEGGAATTVDGVGGSEQQRPLSPPPPGGAGGSVIGGGFGGVASLAV